jgi:hypothetical protein
MRTYFLYRHIRLDKNQIFYIGIGTIPLNPYGNTLKAYYWRAFEKNKSRNSYWKNIVKKTDYKVEIMFETENIELIQKKEIEFIALYKDTLCNLTKGGFGIESYRHSEETKNQIKLSLTGRKRPQEVNDKVNKAKWKTIYLLEDNKWKHFESIISVIAYLGLGKNVHSNICRCANKKTKFAYGYQFSFEIVEL